MEQHLSCSLRSFEDGSIEAGWGFGITSRGIDRKGIEQAAASLVETVAPGMQRSQLLMRLSPPTGSASEHSEGTGPQAGPLASSPQAADWRIRLEGPLGVTLDFASQPHYSASGATLPVQWSGALSDVYETVLLAFVMPFVGSTVTWLNVDWADLKAILHDGSRRRLVVTALSVQATTQELAAAHRQDLREANIRSAAATYSVFMAPRRAMSEQTLAERVAYEEVRRDATAISTYVPVLRSDRIRIATICVYREQRDQPGPHRVSEPEHEAGRGSSPHQSGLDLWRVRRP